MAAVAGKFFVKGSLQGTQWLYANVSPVFEVDSVVVMQCSDSSPEKWTVLVLWDRVLDSD